MMNKFLSATLVLAMASPVFASTVRDYTFSDLAKLSAEELENFNSTLAHTLNVLQRCPEKNRSEFNFGNTLKSLHYTSSRSGTDTYTIEASGQRPAPSFQKFDVTISVESKIAPRKGPTPADAPPLRYYHCKTEYK